VGNHVIENPQLIITLAPEGQPRHAKCSACDADIDVGTENTQPKERKQKLSASFAEHVKTKHQREEFSHTAARIVREATFIRN
jgi:hypothetical protein